MYWYRDCERDIPNTFDPVSANKFFNIPILIWKISKGFVKRENVPAYILRRVDAEIEFQKDPDEKNIANFFAPNIKDEWFSKNDIIDCLKLGSIKISQLTSVIAIRVDKLDEFNRYRVSKLPNRSRPYQESSHSGHSEIVNPKKGEFR